MTLDEYQASVLYLAYPGAVALIEARVRDETKEECAKVCDAHDPVVEGQRKYSNLRGFSDERIAEIRAEERGEKIGAQVCAHAIRALKP
jgi:hypothetical protein